MTVETPHTGDPISYFAPSPSSPWRWTKDGRVLVWYDGSTVAFREELEQILRYLTPKGLPAFGSVVLLLAALKGKIPDGSFLAGPATLELIKESGGGELRLMTSERIEKALDSFADIASLSLQKVPALATARGKAVLVETILESAPCACLPERARSLLDDLSAGAVEGDGFVTPSWRSPSRMLQDIEALVEGWKRFDSAGFNLRLRTGLDAVPDAFQLEELSASERARELLRELSRNESLFGLARLARDLMAAIYLPNRLLPRDEAPGGGYSDIANHGTLDRLLLSELAHDDLTLAVRVALNEALYVKREPPAESPEGRFALLIDTGLRMWGIPRLYAAAAALALVALQPRKRQVSVFRTRGERVEEVDLLSLEGLTKLLEALETEVHPGNALAAFHSRLESHEESECVLITEADTLADPDFRASLRHQGRQSFDVLHLASVSRSGEFRLVSHEHPDGKALARATLDVSQLFSEPKKAPVLVEPAHDRALPFVLGVKPFPFLLPVRESVRHVVNRVSGEGVSVTNDGRLLAWADRLHGARELAANLPHGETHLLEVDEARILLVKSRRKSASVTAFDRENGKLSTVWLDLADVPVGALYSHGAILFVSASAVEAVDPSTGERLGRITYPFMRWAGGRYFTDPGWFALHWDGQFIRFEPIPFADTNLSDVLQVFDSNTHEGPLALVRHAGVRSSLGETLVQGDVSRFVAAAEDGSRIIGEAAKGGFLRFDLHGRQVFVDSVLQESWLATKAGSLPARGLRYNLTHVSRLDSGGILVRTPKGGWLRVLAEDDSLVLSPCPEPTGGVAAFSPVAGKPLGLELLVATWEDGARAYLDGRGLLHLKPKSEAATEVSLVLGESELAAWTSDGAVCGPAFFLPGGSNETPEGMLERIQRAMRRPKVAPRKGLNLLEET